MADDAGATPPVKPRFLPPVYFVAAVAVMLELGFYLPVAIVLSPPVTYVGAGLIGAGLAVVMIVWRRFERAETTIKPYESSTALVTDGLFALSRNPIYTAMVLALIGVAVLLGTVTPLVVIPIFIYLIQRNFIIAEERMLEEVFGDEYRAYKSRVRRWL